MQGRILDRYTGKQLAALQAEAESGIELETPTSEEVAADNSLIPEDLRRVLSAEEIDALIDAMEETAVEAEQVPYTREEWNARFSNPIETPAGKVRMGEHQFGKLHPDGNEQHQDRRGWIGQIHATLTSPSIIVEQPSPEAGAEREYKYVFVKSFVNADGNTVTFFASVTVKKNDMEVVITNHYKKYKDVKNLLKKGKLYFSSVSPSGMQTEPNRSTASATTSKADNSAGASASKGTSSAGTSQGNAEKSLQEIPTRKTKQGTEVLYHEVPVARTLEELYDGTLTQPEVDAFVEANVKESRKAAEKIEKQPPKMTTDLAAYKQAKAEWQAKVDEARRKADYWEAVAAEVKRITGRQNESASRLNESASRLNETASRLSKEEGRAERDDLAGVPDMMDDTPQDARDTANGQQGGTAESDVQGGVPTETAQGTDGRGRSENKGDLAKRKGDLGASVKTSETETDEDGSPFVLSSSGTTTFGEIKAETGLPPAPIKLSLGNSKYGLIHIERRHGEQIRNAGFKSVEEFVEYVCKNYKRIKQGENSVGEENGTYLLQIEDAHNNTLYIELSTDGRYWNVNSGGVFRKGYGNNKKEVWSASEAQNKQSVADSTLREEDKSDNPTTPNGDVPTTSADKSTAEVSDLQEIGLESEEGRFKSKMQLRL